MASQFYIYNSDFYTHPKQYESIILNGCIYFSLNSCILSNNIDKCVYCIIVADVNIKIKNRGNIMEPLM